MTVSTLHNSIAHLHASACRCVLAITGGGAATISELVRVPGASNTLLEATVPYAETALASYLGFTPESACSELTARSLAMAAYQRARKLADTPHNLIGLGATASLVSTRPKRGDHRVHIAWQSESETGVSSLTLTKGARDRAAEEALTTEFILHTLLAACGLAPGPLAILPTEIPTPPQIKIARDEWRPLMRSESLPAPSGPQPIILPGAFNPPHAGHFQMAELAAARYGRLVTWELSVTNVDKPPLDYLEISARLGALAGRLVWLTCAPTFVEKARLAPGAIFVVGADTIERIAAPRYYGGSVAARDAAIRELANLGVRFCVFGRLVGEQFAAAETLNLPPQLAALCDAIMATEFRCDISSTELRKQGGEKR